MTIASTIIDSTNFHDMRAECMKYSTSKRYDLEKSTVEYRFEDGSGILIDRHGIFGKCENIIPQNLPEFV